MFMTPRDVPILFGGGRLSLRVPASADTLTGPQIPKLADPAAAVRSALQNPIASESLRSIAEAKSPGSVVITMSDITRHAPNEPLSPAVSAEVR